MHHFRRIMVAVKDPQARAQFAVDKAAQLARASGADMELFHDMDVPVYLDTTGVDTQGYQAVSRELRSRALEQLERLAIPLRKRGIKVAISAVWDFPAHEAIVRRAVASHSDLIVADCRPGKRFAPYLLRLTDWELLRHSPIPVLLVKSSRRYVRPVILSAVDPSHAHAKPSKLDDEIISASLAVKAALRGTLHAIHSYNPFPVSATPADILSPKFAERVERYQEKTARARLRKALKKARIPGIRQHLTCSYPYDAIQVAAKRLKCSIVVMGAVSRSGLKRLLIGNTAERLLDELSCDVLVVKPRRFASHIPRAANGMRLITSPPISIP